MSKASVARRVVKLGGSLLELTDWSQRLRRWLDRDRMTQTVLVVGGGRAVDALREANQHAQLDEIAAHWMCVAAMAVNSRQVAAVFDVPVVGVSALDQAAPTSSVCVIDPWQFLWHEEPSLTSAPLNASWDVTSDSIAARLADVLGIDELVLLKSRLPQSIWTTRDAAEAGYVDRFFPQAAHRMRVKCVDLRSAAFSETTLQNG